MTSSRGRRKAGAEAEPGLVPELVPGPLWGLSGYRLLSRGEWKAIRQATLADAADVCAACGIVIAGGRFMVCDEVWSYDEARGVAELTGFRMLCPDCDKARHFGLAGVIDRSDVALAQLASVNGINPKEARRLQRQATADWRRRSALKWRVEVDPALLRRWPPLRVLVGRRGGSGSARLKESRG